MTKPNEPISRYGWEICDEVQRFIGNASEIQFIEYSAYETLKRQLDCAMEAMRDVIDAEIRINGDLDRYSFNSVKRAIFGLDKALAQIEAIGKEGE